jgi:predicted  nucleic acid-binding Zn-ribbon protein
MDAALASERDRIMNIFKSFGLPLVAAAAILGGAGLACAETTLTKALSDLTDATKTFAQLQDEREKAEAALKQAQAELDVVSKLSPKASDDIAKIQKRVDDANATLKHNAELTEAKKRAFNESAKRIIEQHANNPQPGTGSNRPASGSGASQPASNQPGPNSDLAAELEKLAADRVKAEAELAKAKADLEALKKQDPQFNQKTEALKKQVQDAQARIKRATDVLGRTQKRTLEFEAKSQQEVDQALKLPQVIQSLINLAGPHKVTDNVSAQGIYNPVTKKGTITITWKGNP